jgi:hypothetical protein
MAESDSARYEAITAAREKATDLYEPVERERERALGLVGLTLTSPLGHLQDATEELLKPERSPTLILRLPKPVKVPVGDRAEIERLVEFSYLAAGWTGIDELIDQVWFLSQSHTHGRLSDARAATVVLDDLKLAAAGLGQRIGQVLVTADAEVVPAALKVLKQSRDATDREHTGLHRDGGAWAFDDNKTAKKTRELAEGITAAWKPVQEARERIALKELRDNPKRGDRVDSQSNPLDLWIEVSKDIEAWERSAEGKALLDKFQVVLDDAAHQRWLLDRWWMSLEWLPAASPLASSLGDAVEEVWDANKEVDAAIRKQGSNRPWANAARPDVALAKTIQSEISAWRYRLLVTAVTGAMGFLPGTFEWKVIQQVYSGVELLAREDKEFDAALGTTSSGAGLLSMIPVLRPVFTPLCAGLSAWRIYREWSRRAVEVPSWWAVLDPDFSSRAPAPDLIALLLDSGMAMLDVAAAVPLASLVEACQRWAPMFLLVLKLAETPGPALRLAEAEMQAARIEMTAAADVAQAAYADRLAEVAAARPTVPTPVRPVAPPAAATATPRPVTPQPAPTFPSDLAGQMERRMEALVRAAAERGGTAATPKKRPSPLKQSAAPAPWVLAASSLAKRRRRPKKGDKPSPETPEKKRRRLGVPIEGYLLGPPKRGVKGERNWRQITFRVGDPVKRVERMRPDLLPLLPQEMIDQFPVLAERVETEAWELFKKRVKLTRPEQLYHLLHLSGPGLGVDVIPELFGPYVFNLSGQARVENLGRRLKNLYQSEGQYLFAVADEYAFKPVVPNSKWFANEVVYTLYKGDVSTQNKIVQISIEATRPLDYARTGQAVAKGSPILIDGPLYMDAVHAAPQEYRAFKRGIISDSD